MGLRSIQKSLPLMMKCQTCLPDKSKRHFMGWGGVMSPDMAPHFIDTTPTQPSPIEGEGSPASARA